METFAGSCHCGRVHFEVDVTERVALTCNCSICHKKGFVHVIVPKAQFRALGGAEALTTYRFNTGVAQHTFCAHCGVQAYYTPRSHPEGVSVNLRALDPAVAATFSLQDFDGANWEANIDRIR